jgi:hypothetical protein
MAIVVAEVNARVRFLLGGADTTVISDATLNSIIDDCILSIGDADELFCEVVYCSLINTLRYLIREQQMNAGSTSNTTKRREKVGKREIELEFDTGYNTNNSGWQAMLDDYLLNPEYVCAELATSTPTTGIHIGGVSETEYDRVNSDVDSRNAYQLSVRRKYGTSTSRVVRRRRGFSY